VFLNSRAHLIITGFCGRHEKNISATALARQRLSKIAFATARASKNQNKSFSHSITIRG